MKTDFKNNLIKKIQASVLFLEDSQKNNLLNTLDKLSDFNAQRLDEKLTEMLSLEEQYLQKIQKEQPEVFTDIDKTIDKSQVLQTEKSHLLELKNEILELAQLAQENQ